MSNNYLTAEEVGQRMQISTKQVYELAKKRQVPGVKVGKYWRFNEDKLFKAIEMRFGNN
ncbi:helix-turn-helix domain-containing protein [Anaerospora hongkongensis]|uniref:helix-turn-helix domain-containing protein n=1 Tax=Anaerospora hongkongensis TaxID=244830 RepID=UPI002FD98FCD